MASTNFYDMTVEKKRNLIKNVSERKNIKLTSTDNPQSAEVLKMDGSEI